MGIPVACSDDADVCPGSTGSGRSYIPCLQLDFTSQYYIVVDGGTAGACGDYELSIDYCVNSPCHPLDVPSFAIPENENNCYTDYVDVSNGGCDSPVPEFMPITGGQVIYGHSGTYAQHDSSGAQVLRFDSDWYHYVAAHRVSLVWRTLGDFSRYMSIYTGTSCTDTVQLASRFDFACETGTLTQCVDPGSYWLKVEPSPDTRLGCEATYLAWVEEHPCGLSHDCNWISLPLPYYSNTDQTIGEDTTTCIDIDVPDSFYVADVNVGLDNFGLWWDPNLAVWLESPAGTTVSLVGHRIHAGDFSCALFDDSAAMPVSAGSPPFFGPYQPQSPLAAFNGEFARGTWRLCFRPSPNVGPGWLRQSALMFQQGSAACPRADSVTVAFDAVLQASKLTWSAPVAGVYDVWTTAVRNNQGNPLFEPNWTLKASVVVPLAGRVAWTDPDPIACYRNYVVIHNCSAGH